MKHRASSTHRMDAPHRYNGQTDNWTNGHVSLSICFLDGVWHIRVVDSGGKSADGVQVPRRVGRMHRSHLLESTSGHAQCGDGSRATSRGRRRSSTRRNPRATSANRKSRDPCRQQWRRRRRPRILHDIVRLLPSGQGHRLSWHSTPVAYMKLSLCVTSAW